MKTALEEILFEIDCDFSPNLSSKINVTEYVDKIIKRATVIPIYINGKMEAFIAVYCNDYDHYIAYLTMIAIRKEYRSKGLGKLLVGTAIAYLKALNFQNFRLEVFKSNRNAYLLYNKLGFTVYKEEQDSFFMEKKLC